MKKIFILFILLFPLNLYAKDIEMYSVQRPDGGVSIVYYVSGSRDSLTDVLNANGFSGYPVSAIKESDIPKDRTYRNAWTKLGKQIVEDPVKKEEIISQNTKELGNG